MFEIQDLMSFLEAEYASYQQAAADYPDEEQPDFTVTAEDGAVDVKASFANFCRTYLAEVNQPANVVYLPRGLGLRLQRGQTLAFVPQTQAEGFMRDEGIHITRPSALPGMGMLPGGAIPVTGGFR
jgi:hypothetical protein